MEYWIKRGIPSSAIKSHIGQRISYLSDWNPVLFTVHKYLLCGNITFNILILSLESHWGFFQEKQVFYHYMIHNMKYMDLVEAIVVSTSKNWFICTCINIPGKTILKCQYITPSYLHVFQFIGAFHVKFIIPLVYIDEKYTCICWLIF